jgi:hypothetical protein
MTQGKYEKRIKALELRARAEDSSDRELSARLTKLSLDFAAVRDDIPEPGTSADPMSHIQSVRNAMGVLAARVTDVEKRVTALFQPTITVGRVCDDFDPDKVARAFASELHRARDDDASTRTIARLSEETDKLKQEIDRLRKVVRQANDRHDNDEARLSNVRRDYQEVLEQWRRQQATIARLQEQTGGADWSGRVRGLTSEQRTFTMRGGFGDPSLYVWKVTAADEGALQAVKRARDHLRRMNITPCDSGVYVCTVGEAMADALREAFGVRIIEPPRETSASTRGVYVCTLFGDVQVQEDKSKT